MHRVALKNRVEDEFASVRSLSDVFYYKFTVAPRLAPWSVPVLQLVEGGESALAQPVQLLAQDVHLVRLRAGQLGDRQTKHIVRQKSRVSAPSRVEPS